MIDRKHASWILKWATEAVVEKFEKLDLEILRLRWKLDRGETSYLNVLGEEEPIETRLRILAEGRHEYEKIFRFLTQASKGVRSETAEEFSQRWIPIGVSDGDERSRRCPGSS